MGFLFERKEKIAKSEFARKIKSKVNRYCPLCSIVSGLRRCSHSAEPQYQHMLVDRKALTAQYPKTYTSVLKVFCVLSLEPNTDSFFRQAQADQYRDSHDMDSATITIGSVTFINPVSRPFHRPVVR